MYCFNELISKDTDMQINSPVSFNKLEKTQKNIL